jgi:hypothetical protein
MLRLPLSKKERGVLNDTSHKSALTMSNADNEEAVHNPSHWDGGNEYGQLQFQSTTLNQQAEKFQVAHQSSAITPTRLVPLLEARRELRDLMRVEAPAGEQVCFTQSDVRRR